MGLCHGLFFLPLKGRIFLGHSWDHISTVETTTHNGQVVGSNPAGPIDGAYSSVGRAIGF